MKSERRTVLGFLLLTFVLSIPIWALGGLFEIQLLPGLPVGVLAAFTPAVAVSVIAYRHGRRSAVLALLRRSLDAGRVTDGRWYFVVVLFSPAVAGDPALDRRSMSLQRLDRLEGG